MPKYKKGYPCRNKENPVSHWDEITRIKRIIGTAEGVIKMIKEKDHSCKEILNQLLNIIGHCEQVGTFILIKHLENCLKEEGFPDDEDKRNEEIELALRYKKRFKPKKWGKKRLEDIEYDL